MREELDKKKDYELLNYTLRKDFFINKNLFFENLLHQCSNDCNEKYKLYCEQKKIYLNPDFLNEIKQETKLNNYYENAKRKIENENTIEILKNGLLIHEGKMLLYCIKDDKSLLLESVVNYYFNQFILLPLPNLIFNLNYIKIGDNSDNSINSINLFFEWDGCYFLNISENKNENDSYSGSDLLLPFHGEMKYKMTKKKTELLNNNILIKKDSIIFIDVKTNFPKEEEEDKNNNFENIIKVMFAKLNYFIYLYSEILKKKVKEIKIILLYDQNRLIKYKDNIIEYIDKYKNDFIDIDTYEIYFDILYIIPYISKLSLNDVTKELLEINKRIEKLEEDNKRIKQLEEENRKRIEKLEEDNKRIEKLEEENRKRIEKLEEDNKGIKPLEEDNKSIKKLEEEIEKFKNELALIKLQIYQLKQNKIKEDEKIIVDKKGKNDKRKNITPEYNNKIKKIYDNILTKDDTHKNNVSTQSKIIKTKQQLDNTLIKNKENKKRNEINQKKEYIPKKNKKNKVEIQDEKIIKQELNISGNLFIDVDNIYKLIKLKIDNNKTLLEKEKVYKLIYENCRKELNIENFNLMDYKTNHCSGNKSIIKDAFHKALKKLTKEQRKLFFNTYKFLPCMTECFNLI